MRKMKIIMEITLDQLELLESILHQEIGDEINNEEMDRKRIVDIRAIWDSWRIAE